MINFFHSKFSERKHDFLARGVKIKSLFIELYESRVGLFFYRLTGEKKKVAGVYVLRCDTMVITLLSAQTLKIMRALSRANDKATAFVGSGAAAKFQKRDFVAVDSYLPPIFLVLSANFPSEQETRAKFILERL